MKYVLVGSTTNEPLSYMGRVIVHDNRSELEFLFPNNRVAPLPRMYASDLTIELKDHPDMSPVIFPLEQNMKQFRK